MPAAARTKITPVARDSPVALLAKMHAAPKNSNAIAHSSHKVYAAVIPRVMRGTCESALDALFDFVAAPILEVLESEA
jgi:hypothetical protein